MCSALRVVDIVTEAQNIFMELVRILERDLHANAFALTAEVDHIMDRF